MNELANDGGRFFYERYCEFDTDGSAWTVIQRRFASHPNFTREWQDYKLGFGNLTGQFWFGNDFIHMLTLKDDMELRIIVADRNGSISWMEYSTFKMASEEFNYKLTIDGYR